MTVPGVSVGATVANGNSSTKTRSRTGGAANKRSTTRSVAKRKAPARRSGAKGRANASISHHLRRSGDFLAEQPDEVWGWAGFILGVLFVLAIYFNIAGSGALDIETLKRVTRRALGRLVSERTKRRPMIVPVLMEA